MIMDPSYRGYSSGPMNGIHLETPSFCPNPSFVSMPRFDDIGDRGGDTFVATGHVGYLCPQPNPTPDSNGNSLSCDSPEDCDFSDTVLNYISQILMEEDVEGESYTYQESVDLQAAEKPFYEALGKKYPPSPEPSRGFVFQNGADFTNYSEYLVDNALVPNWSAYGCQLYDASQSSYSSSNSAISSVDGLLDSPSSIVQVPDFGNESRSEWQLRKGVEEASRFLPNRSELIVDTGTKGASFRGQKAGTAEVSVKAEKKDGSESLLGRSKGRKSHYRDGSDVEEEERSNKQAAIYIESTLRSKMFDLVLLCSNGDGASHLSSVRETMRNGISQSTQKNGGGQSKGQSGGKGRGKKSGGKKEVVDLRTLLIQCAQAVAADDHRSANELLKQVRQHASPFGDGNQRLANCFADGLEARLAGTGSQIYKGLISKRTCAADVLKAYLIYIAACPFRKISNFASNRTIMNVSAKATKVHVIDFGILYGFQWPTLIQRISGRAGGPPKLRITGIEFPQSGFRPAERVEEAGRRLKAYAEGFKVPFEYNAIAKKWETITLDELKIEKDEFVVVNCLYRAKNLLDESVTVESPRFAFLDLVKKINPDIFIQGIVNGSYNAPFFVTRFREALFHFSALFDMLETIVPRSEPERMLLEKEIFGREALNVIACEGSERVERPETYKQWQIRIMRSGFVQIPFGRDIMKRATEKVRSNYHRDFIIDNDTGWLLQGWKGRIMFALSTWKPA